MTRETLQGVKKIIAVASGKGGVGKTTVTVNLALALQQQGANVGIFDADIYGPNVPLILGIHRRRPGKGGNYLTLVRPQSSQPTIPPLERFGLHIMSVGLLMAESQLINPPPDAVGQLVLQMLRDIIWPDLDYLLIDLPPSAGQPQADLLRTIDLAGAIIVTTPQDLSLLDASRSLLMFQKTAVSLLGVIENMSYFICPNCDEKHEIFQRPTQQPQLLADAPLLGRIPLTPTISQTITKASPLLQTPTSSTASQAFHQIASHLIREINTP